MRFRRVLSALWRKRKASHEGMFFVAGAARGHLAPHGGLLVAKKVLIVSVLTFVWSRMEFWCHPGTLDFSSFWSFLASWRPSMGCPTLLCDPSHFEGFEINHKLALSSEILKMLLRRPKSAFGSSQRRPWKDLVQYLFIDMLVWPNGALYAAAR